MNELIFEKEEKFLVWPPSAFEAFRALSTSIDETLYSFAEDEKAPLINLDQLSEVQAAKMNICSNWELTCDQVELAKTLAELQRKNKITIKTYELLDICGDFIQAYIDSHKLKRFERKRLEKNQDFLRKMLFKEWPFEGKDMQTFSKILTMCRSSYFPPIVVKEAL